MPNKKIVEGGCKSTTSDKGYQPQKPEMERDRSGNVSGGYKPTTSEGDNPGNKPPPQKP